MSEIAYDMPKLESPFVRKVNEKGEYVVTPEIAPGYEWVFNDTTVRAIEKLHGTNVSIVLEGGNVRAIYNRTNLVMRDGLRIGMDGTHRYIIEAVLRADEREYLAPLGNGQWFGEVLGPKVNGNPYSLDEHIWIPFKTYAWDHLYYKSWGKYPKDFDTMSKWFQNDLMPLFSLKKHGKEFEKHFVEGVVFTHPDGRMAKLRRDMFDWYVGRRHDGRGRDGGTEK